MPEAVRLPIFETEWQKLHQLLAMAPHKLGPPTRSREIGENPVLTLKFDEPVVVDVTGGGRTGAGLAAALLYEVHIGGPDGIDLKIGDRSDKPRQNPLRSVSVGRVTAVEQALR